MFSRCSQSYSFSPLGAHVGAGGGAGGGGGSGGGAGRLLLLHMVLLLPLRYVVNRAVGLWLYLVLKCLQLGNVKNVEGGGSDLAGSAKAS